MDIANTIYKKILPEEKKSFKASAIVFSILSSLMVLSMIAYFILYYVPIGTTDWILPLLGIPAIISGFIFIFLKGKIENTFWKSICSVFRDFCYFIAIGVDAYLLMFLFRTIFN
jgi:hypothetical protein